MCRLKALVVKDSCFLCQVPRTEEDIVNSLPNKDITMDIMVVSKLFSSRPAKALGDWEFQFQFDPPAIKAEKE